MNWRQRSDAQRQTKIYGNITTYVCGNIVATFAYDWVSVYVATTLKRISINIGALLQTQTYI